MKNPKKHNGYLPTIGIECHVQLKTATKLFAAVGNDAREAPPNTLVSHICFGLPGALPVLNKEAVRLASRAAFALGVPPQKHSQFERKHYFYPDLPKGYQITQLADPIVAGGEVSIEVDGESVNIRINRAQLEEDAGKNTHPAGQDYSLVDLNRAGTPLLEIVSEPDMHSSAEARAYTRELYLLMKYADISDANLYYGNMRFDVNVSVSKDESLLGTRTETKNLNSFKSVEKTIDFEIKRQTELLEKGHPIVQETRGWDEAKQKTVTQRSKENAHDYRYFPDPDIPPIELSDEFIEEIKKELPLMPAQWRQSLSKLGLDSSQIELLLDAEVEEGQPTYLSLIEMNLNNPDFAKRLVNLLINVEIPLRRDSQITKVFPDSERSRMYLEIYKLSSNGKLSSTKAKELIEDLIRQDHPPSDIADHARDKGFIQVSDEAEVLEIIKRVISDNQRAVDDIKAGEAKAIGFLVGQVMKESKGKANPELAREFLKRELGVA